MDIKLSLNSLFASGVPFVGDFFNATYMTNARVGEVDFKMCG